MSSWFDSVKSFAQNLVGAEKSAKIASGANKALTVITSPIQSITNFKKAEAATAEKSTLRLLGEGIANTLAVVTPFTAAGKAAVVSVAKSLVPTTAKGALTAAVAVPVATGVLTSSPKARESLVDAPGGLVNLGTNIGKIVENPSVATVKETFTENPVLATGIAVATVGGVALAASPIIASVANTRAINESTEATQEAYRILPTSDPQRIVIEQMPTIVSPAPSPAVVAPLGEAPAVTPKKVTKKKKKAKKKPAKKKKTRRSKKKAKKKTTKKKKKTIKRSKK